MASNYIKSNKIDNSGYPQRKTSPGFSNERDSFDEEVGPRGFEFNEKDIRVAFIRKVYSILMVQLSITFGFVAFCIFYSPIKDFIKRNPHLMWVAFGILIVTLISMSCCTSVRRNYPMNIIFLSIFTLAKAFMLGVVASLHHGMEILLAIGITAVVCITLTMFAFVTKWDFTSIGGFLLVVLIILLIFGIVNIFVKNRILSIFYASLGALLFSLYLIYDTQLIMGGNHKYSMSPDEYIFAALSLYLDVVNIFLFILQLLSDRLMRIEDT